MSVRISPRAINQLKKLEKIDQLAISKRIQDIQNSPDIRNVEKLSGYTDVFRVRVGNYRIVYKKLKNAVFIISIGHRKEIYKDIKQLASL